MFIAIALLAVSQLLSETKSGFELVGVGSGYQYDHPYEHHPKHHHKHHHKPPPHHPHKPHHKPHHNTKKCSGPSGAGLELLVLSANSWCGFCKKMHGQVDELRKELGKHDIKLVYISDTECKDKFEKLKKKYNCQGFPCSFFLVDGEQVGDKISGFMPAAKMAAKAASLK
jgi:thiol-disulfide isomerase/thioredoxin